MTSVKENAPNSVNNPYPQVDPSPDFAALEQDILKFWKESQAFPASVEARPASDEFVFYDGPPFANGLPHYGHLLTGFVKDVFARYQTMKGKRTERRFGWDCHGLPAEMGAEKELKISGRLAIEQFGIGNFNDHCRTSVMKYTNEWEDYVTRQARWVDFANDYKTMDKNFMESVLWAFKQLHDKGLVYESHRVMPYSWAAETPLSNFETKLDNSYREREDKAITVAFKLKDKPKGAPEAKDYYVLAWTTTPWTLPSNLALAVCEELTYMPIIKDDNCYYLACSAVSSHLKDFDFSDAVFEKIQTDDLTLYKAKPNPSEEQAEQLNAWHELCVGGKDLLGLTYEPLFPYFENQENAFQIISGDFIEEGSGTGVVHIAPGFGEDDQRVAADNGIGVVVPVDGQGKYTDAIFDITKDNYPDLPPLSLKGLNVIAQEEGQCEAEPYKPEQLKKYGLVNLRIINWLKLQNKLPAPPQDYKHNYPHCWRTDTPLIYRAMPSWYVEVTKFRDRAAEVNKTINWIPEHVRDGQMHHMLSTAPDWSISRNRFWGTPIPVWRAPSGKVIVCGSIAEIEEYSGKKVEDLHRPIIDDITFEKDGETYTRVTDVFDCWFESGSMPFAQVHYPFENKDWFEAHFPADFITEYVGQTRGWFNTLIMLSTALFDKAPFKNCICHGVVLDSETGLKYSKRLKNYKDPMEVFDKFGADALRWMMLDSPVMRGLDIAVDPEGKFIRDSVRLYIKPFWNAYNFFTLYANADGIEAKLNFGSDNVMDRYILSKLATAVRGVEKGLDAYDTPAATHAVTEFFEVLNNWYIRRNKERFWKAEHDADKQAAYDTLYTVLHVMTRAAAPLLPLVTEAIYLGLTVGDANATAQGSVHLQRFPSKEVADYEEDAQLMANMDLVQAVCNAALGVRNKQNIRVRQPLSKLTVEGEPAISLFKDSKAQLYLSLISDEINVKAVELGDDMTKHATLKVQVNLPKVGKSLGPKVKDVMGAAKRGEWTRNDDGTITLGGVTLQDDEVLVQLEPNAEYKDCAQALSTNDALVVLDLTVTPELEAEGVARDLVRLIQQARKDADLNVSDKIELALELSENAQKAAQQFESYISEQTLAASVVYADAKQAVHHFEQTLDDAAVVIGFNVAKAA